MHLVSSISSGTHAYHFGSLTTPTGTVKYPIKYRPTLRKPQGTELDYRHGYVFHTAQQ